MTCLQKIIDLEEKTMLKFDTLKNDYPSRRSVIYGRKGMVCTSQPLAAQAGLDIIKQGGNAIDAAIAGRKGSFTASMPVEERPWRSRQRR